jgi:hypothetical protein
VVAGLCVAGALVVDRWHARKRVTEGCCVQRCTPGPMPERANLDTRFLGCADVAASHSIAFSGWEVQAHTDSLRT